MYTLELAREADVPRCGEILDEGRAFQRAQGFVQWTEDYPSREILERDLRSRKGYALLADGELAGYLCLDFDGEPAYGAMDGAWGTEEPYGVVHRMAFAAEFQGKGLSDAAFRLIEEACRSRGVRSLRMDTDPSNSRMQHILEKNGMVRRGVISYQGDGKLAYDKAL